MSKNYKAIHYIQKQLKDFNDNFVDSVVRCFNQIESMRAAQECVTSSVILYICAKHFGYEPKICYGLCTLQGKEFYHAWLEINNKVIDVAIYGNINYNVYSMWDFKLETPYIGTYEDAATDPIKPLVYGKFVFDDDWSHCSVSMIEKMTMQQYMDKAPQNILWKYTIKFLNQTPSKALVDSLSEHIKGVSFTDFKNN